MKEVNPEEIKLTAIRDRIFKEIFYDEKNKELLIAVVETCLGIKITNVEYKNNELPQGNYRIKGKRLDILLDTDEGKINVELNASKNKYTNARNFSYICNIYIRNTLVGDNYSEEIDVIQINLTFGLGRESEEIFEEYYVMNKKGKMYIKNLTIYEFNMDKIMEFWYSKDEEQIERYKYLIMLDLKSEDLEELSGMDERVEKYKMELESVNVSIGINDWISEEQDQEMIRNSLLQEGYNNGMKKGLEDGIKKGIAQGVEQGKEQGFKIAVLNLFNHGMSKEEIANICNVAVDKIDKIIEDEKK